MNMPLPATSRTPEDLAVIGEQIYFENQETLETDHLGEFAVIEIDSRDITVNADKLAAIQEAQARHAGKLFYIVQIGKLKRQPGAEINEARRYGWSF